MNTKKPFTVAQNLDNGGRLELEEKDFGDMKTENTCMHCAELECYARLNCEGNELPTETQEPQDKIENESNHSSYRAEVDHQNCH